MQAHSTPQHVSSYSVGSLFHAEYGPAGQGALSEIVRLHREPSWFSITFDVFGVWKIC